MKKKTKKILLSIFTILGLLIDLCYALAIYSGAIQLEVIGDNLQTSTNSQILLLSISGLANLISIIFIAKDLIAHKKKLIVFNVIQILFGNILNVLFGIINIFILTSKTKDVEEVKEKKELPILEDITKHKWYVYFIIFVFLFVICYTPITNLLPIQNNRIAVITVMILIYIIQISLLVIPMANELKRDFVVFKNNFKLYLAKTLPRFGLIILAYLICNMILIVLIGDTSTNQSIINSLPIYISAFLAIIVAPLTEELMFRGFIKKFIKNDILFILVSSIIFGGLHVMVSSSWQQILYIIPYSIIGFALSLNYVKTKNIVSNIFIHAVWNSIGVIAMILTNLL